jgi:hypothetical protein
VPVKAFFENLESRATVDQFLGWFPDVNREQVLAVLAFGSYLTSVRVLFDQGMPVLLRTISANTRSQLAAEMG